MKSLKIRLIAAIGAFGLALAGIAAVAQVQVPYVTSISTSDAMQVIPRGAPGPSNVYATMQQLRSWVFSSNSQQTSGTPAISSCGTSPAVTTGSTDYAGTITTGTGTPTACTITFSVAYGAAPACVVTSRTAPATSTPAYTVSTTAITLAQAAVSSVVWDYICVGRTGT
jgi:hypothetical protein